MLAFAAGVAHARNLQTETLDDGVDDGEVEVIEEPEMTSFCRNRATGRDFWCWLRSDLYHSFPRDKKMEEL